ncbi:hypothetical protein [Natrinema sp. 1APR25-10V2]|uniref:hypothetical protein n=1 Tax=Natrinema sp. 1APR25-10V2 TaxID=2951081 RepID=UPI002874CCAA|nr:hypothetical protein [Natrinema sp. 1APR25-10V2]MDS0478103.1 hypothetical protein [Natrinema sp. 1APR25-10V2]
MIRVLTGVIGAVTALAPERVIVIFEKLAIANPGKEPVRAWIQPAVRAEGILIAAISLFGGQLYAWLMNLTGAFGTVVFLFPNLYRKFATAFLYEKPDAVEWNQSFTAEVRAIGAIYAILASKRFRRRHNDSESTSTSDRNL